MWSEASVDPLVAAAGWVVGGRGRGRPHQDAGLLWGQHVAFSAHLVVRQQGHHTCGEGTPSSYPSTEAWEAPEESGGPLPKTPAAQALGFLSKRPAAWGGSDGGGGGGTDSSFLVP